MVHGVPTEGVGTSENGDMVEGVSDVKDEKLLRLAPDAEDLRTSSDSSDGIEVGKF